MKLKKFQKIIFFIIISGCLLASVYSWITYRTATFTSLDVHNQKVDLKPLGEDWSKVCVLGPYSTNETAIGVTGLNINIEGRSGIRENDSIALLITLNEQGDYALFEVSRRPSDFTRLSGACWPRGVEFFIAPEDQPFVLHPQQSLE